MNGIVTSMMFQFSTKFRSLLPNRSNLHSVSESIFIYVYTRDGKLSREISLLHVKLVAVEEKVFIFLNASFTRTSWSIAIKLMLKSLLIQCAEVHPKLCQLFDTFYIKDIINSVIRWPYNCK